MMWWLSILPVTLKHWLVSASTTVPRCLEKCNDIITLKGLCVREKAFVLQLSKMSEVSRGEKEIKMMRNFAGSGYFFLVKNEAWNKSTRSNEHELENLTNFRKLYFPVVRYLLRFSRFSQMFIYQLWTWLKTWTLRDVFQRNKNTLDRGGKSVKNSVQVCHSHVPLKSVKWSNRLQLYVQVKSSPKM